MSERAQELRAQAATDAVFARAADSAVAAPSHGVGGDGAAASSGAAGDGGSGAAPVGVHIPPAYLEAALAASSAQLPPLPRVEWWDALILRRGQPDALAAGSTAAARAAAAEGANGAGAATKPPIARYELGVDPEKVTFYVEHPPPVEPPAEPAPPPPQPLPLTAKERKKLRSQRRQAAERAKQDQIRAGLVAPPPPKVKLSNLMKALGEQAVANPTEVEARVRAQVAAREAAHEARNAGAKLSKEERRAKKLDKAKADVAAGVHVVVYRVRARQGGVVAVRASAAWGSASGLAVSCRLLSAVAMRGRCWPPPPFLLGLSLSRKGRAGSAAAAAPDVTRQARAPWLIACDALAPSALAARR